jgi:peptidyl-prolyl cis-trans isomerase D
MLDAMRSNARSSLIVVLFAAIIVTFIFSFGRGSSGFRTKTPETWAAKVNGETVAYTELQQAYARRFKQASEQRGGKYTTDNAKQDNLKSEALKGIVDQELLAQQAQEMGIVVSDEEVADTIAKSPQFQQDGKFDFDYYKRLIENGYGMSIPKFEASVRRDLMRGKVIEAVLNGATVSDDEVKTFFIAQNEGAKMQYVKFTSFMFRDEAKATDAEADEYAKTHQKEIDEAYKKEEKTRWTQGQAVKVRAITVPVPPGATPDLEKAASARMDAAYAEVKAGKDFAEVAKTKSEDSTTKLQGGDLGFISKGGSAYGRQLEEQALKLKVGEISPIFRDRTGFHVLKAEELRAEHVQPLAEVQRQIAKDQLAAKKAGEVAKKKAEEALAKVKGGGNLEELFPGKKQEPGKFDFSSFMKPQAQTTDTFHPMGGYVPGVGLVPKLSAAVFSLNDAGATPPAPVEDGDAFYVFKIVSRERADLSKMTADEKGKLRERLENQRKNEVYTSFIARLRKNSKIVENEAALSYDQSASHETYNPDDY